MCLLQALAAVAASVRQDCERLLERKICFKLLEVGNCTRDQKHSGKKAKCTYQHPEVPAFEDVSALFRLVKDSFPNALPEVFKVK